MIGQKLCGLCDLHLKLQKDHKIRLHILHRIDQMITEHTCNQSDLCGIKWVLVVTVTACDVVWPDD